MLQDRLSKEVFLGAHKSDIDAPINGCKIEYDSQDLTFDTFKESSFVTHEAYPDENFLKHHVALRAVGTS